MSKTKRKVYLYHEISSYLPLLEGEEFDALVEDIRQFGQIESAVLLDGKILDGRNRDRATKKLGIELKVREWKPSEATGMTPLQYVISENIMRRHLNTAQKAEIGLLLLEEEEKLAKERKKEIGKVQAEIQTVEGKQDFQKIADEGVKTHLTQKISEIAKGKSRDIVGKKVKVSGKIIQKAKKIKKVAEKDKEIAEDWEKAKKGDIGVATVYKKVQEKETIEKLPEDLKIVVKREEAKVKEAKKKDIVYEPTITVKKAQAIKDLPIDVREAVVHSKVNITVEEAKEIAEIPNVILRKQEVIERERAKKRQTLEIKKKKDLAEGKTLLKPKYFDKDTSKVKAFEAICKKATNELTFASLEGYGEVARDTCIEMMRTVFEHLRVELRKAGEVAPRRVIDIG